MRAELNKTRPQALRKGAYISISEGPSARDCISARVLNFVSMPPNGGFAINAIVLDRVRMEEDEFSGGIGLVAVQAARGEVNKYFKGYVISAVPRHDYHDHTIVVIWIIGCKPHPSPHRMLVLNPNRYIRPIGV